MRIFYVVMAVRLLGLAVLLATAGLGCSTWIFDHQDAPTGGKSGGSSSTSEESETTVVKPTSEVSTWTTDSPLRTTGYPEPMTTSVPGTSVPEMSSTMNEESSNPDTDAKGDGISAAETSSSTEMSEATDDSAGDCGVEDYVQWGDSCIPRGDVRLVFVTSKRYYGNFGGRIEADKICQIQAAKAVGAHKLEGNFRVWLSAGNDNASEALEEFEGPFVKYDPYAVDNSVVVVSPKDGMGLVSPINVTEEAALVTMDRRAWTGTTPDGMGTGYDCFGWTLVAGEGTFGETDEFDGDWTYSGKDLCVEQRRLYCIQQGPIP